MSATCAPPPRAGTSTFAATIWPRFPLSRSAFFSQSGLLSPLCRLDRPHELRHLGLVEPPQPQVPRDLLVDARHENDAVAGLLPGRRRSHERARVRQLDRVEQAEELVEAAPKTLKEGAGKEECEGFKKELEEAGAVAALK